MFPYNEINMKTYAKSTIKSRVPAIAHAIYRNLGKVSLSTDEIFLL